MKIRVNNEQIEVDQTESIPSVLHRIKINSTQGIAVAVNNVVIAKTTWNTYLIKENDALTVIRATQGG